MVDYRRDTVHAGCGWRASWIDATHMGDVDGRDDMNCCGRFLLFESAKQWRKEAVRPSADDFQTSFRVSPIKE